MIKVKLVGVYNAKGSLFGELTYISKKLLGFTHCALCDLSHGWSPREKASWKQACHQSSLDLSLLHLDELDDLQAEAFTMAPVILAYINHSWQVIMESDEIEASQGDPQHLFNELELKLQSLTQNMPSVSTH
ncbi:MAG: hypothetical protein CMH49_05595 [Myxococcales bacterium]|nr:hypothetical protein [Myxococcales bacterium]